MKLRIPLFLLAIAHFLTPAQAAELTAAPSQPTESNASWRPLLDEKLSNWELWMGSPHTSVQGLPEGTPTSANARGTPPMGLNNDPKHVFTVAIESGEPVLHITGEIWGALTTKESFSNYHLQVDIKWGEKKWEPRLTQPRNSGVLYHCTGPHGAFWNTWKRSLEFEVVENEMADLYPLGGARADVQVIPLNNLWVYDPNGQTKTFGAGITEKGMNRAAKLPGTFENANGQWNTLDLYTLGQTSVRLVNNHLAMVVKNAATLDTTSPTATPLPLTAGQIQLQSESAELYYRRIQIQPLTDFPASLKKAAGL